MLSHIIQNQWNLFYTSNIIVIKKRGIFCLIVLRLREIMIVYIFICLNIWVSMLLYIVFSELLGIKIPSFSVECSNEHSIPELWVSYMNSRTLLLSHQYGDYIFLCHHLHSSIQYIDGSIDVSIVMCMTVWTCPFPDRQVFCNIMNCPAHMTCLATWIPFVYLLKMFTFFLTFVGQHIGKHAPAIVMYAFTKVQTLWHGFHIDIFNANEVICIHKMSWKLMQKVLSLISYLFM